MPTKPPTLGQITAPAKRTPRARPRENRQRTRALHTDSRQWRAIRAGVLAEELYTCASCGSWGNQVDHIDGDDSNQQRSNLWCLCVSCHARKTRIDQVELSNTAALPYWMPSPVSPVILVCGPPGSGKREKAQELAGSVLLLDAEHELLTSKDTAPVVIRRRNAALAAAVKDARPVVVVADASGARHRIRWERWGAQVLALHPGRAECAARIRLDNRRTMDQKIAAIKALENWR